MSFVLDRWLKGLHECARPGRVLSAVYDGLARRWAVSKHYDSGLGIVFLLITASGAVHMGEQLLFGIEEFYMLQGRVESWHALFPSSLQGHAGVMLITSGSLIVSMMIYASMRAGRSAAFVLLHFELRGVGEAHHWLEALQGDC